MVFCTLLFCLLNLTACGRKPHDVDAPPNSVTYTYPSLDKK